MQIGRVSVKSATAVALFFGGLNILATSPAAAQVQQYGTIFGFGDSLLDTRNYCKYLNYPNGGAGTCGNGPNSLQQLPSITGYSFNSANDYAVGGSGTGNEAVLPGVMGQVALLQDSGTRIGANDLVVVSGAGNNHSALFQPGMTPPALAQQALTEQFNNISQLIGLGARNLVVYTSGGTPPTAILQIDRPPKSSPLTFSISRRSTMALAARAHLIAAERHHCDAA
jgi:phospholipase/lecithinase/hemolysin